MEKKRRLKMEQAKAADGYLPKWCSNHLPRQRREAQEKISIVLTLVLLQCSAAIQQQTVVLQQKLLLFLIIPIL